ncbi:MAG TPA: exosortase E/protease, VPEID-CTERM system [Silvibacterium sp.]|nr:exosortase E/protease, VPEID-CTERM system [Silvibacterium sp.]
MPHQLLGRLYLFAAILTVECLILAGIPHSGPLLGPLAPSGIVAFAVFMGLGHSRLKTQRDEIAFSTRLFAAHVFCIAVVVACNLGVLHEFASLAFSRAIPFLLGAVLLLGIILLALACIPLRIWIRTIRATSPLWLLASLAGVLALVLRHPFQSLWGASIADRGRLLQIAAFHSVYAVLHPFLPDLTADPSTWVIGTPRFAVGIGEPCSGLEGLGLVLVFTVIWLWYFRKENRFPQALLLIPCALACVWLLNIVRICAIILIGNAGAPDVAMVGFHSQAGWIAFTAVALLFSMATQKLSWVRRTPEYAPSAARGLVSGGMHKGTAALEEIRDESRESPATAAYLVPFLAILAASFVSKAASGYFEWLYPLRFIAAAVAIWHFRHEYRKLDWRFGWLAPVTGAVIFLLWIAPTCWANEHSASSLGAALAALSPTARAVWIVIRVAAAVITVPFAEELAFRGYLARRLVSRDFDTVSFSSLTVLSVCLSSVAFGLMHGGHWVVGILAGLAYAAVLKWRGRIGDAFVAHATSNLLLAAWVLMRGDWSLW